MTARAWSAPTRLALALTGLVVAGCDCSSFVNQRRFACTTDSQCQDGFVCVDRGDGAECVAAGSAGGDAAGGSAGGAAMGGGDAAGGAAAGGSAGGDAGGSAGGAAGGDATDAGKGGGSALPASALRFVTTPRTVAVATCSQTLTVEPVDVNGVFSPTATTITLSDAGVELFTNAGCTGTPTNGQRVVPGGEERATFYALGSVPGLFQLAATAPALTSATQLLTVLDGPDTLVFTSTAPMNLKAGACFPAVLSSRRGTTPIAPPSPVTVTLSATAGAARFYADPTCETEVTSVSMTTSVETVFVRALSSPSNQLQASVPHWTPATLTVPVTPMVRRGTCFFDAQSLDGGVDGGPGPVDGFSFCNQPGFSVDATSAVVFVQGATSSTVFDDGAVRCRVNTAGTGLNCNRRSGVNAASVHWQVLEDPSRLRVGLFDGTCAASYGLSRVADLSRTFLVRAKIHDSASYDDEDTTVFTFTDGGTVTGTRANCGAPFLQSVEWSGVSVTRGTFDGGMDAGVTELRFGGLAPASNNRVLLLQHGVDVDSSMVPTCAAMARGALPSPTEVVVRRALSTAACASLSAEFVAFERVDFRDRATVQELTVSLPAMIFSMPVTIRPVDPSRTVVFASAQTDLGQSGGETNTPSTSNPFEASFTLELVVRPGLPSNEVTVKRPRASSAASVTFYVLQAE